MMIMINMIGWLTGYVIYCGTPHVSAVILPNFPAKVYEYYNYLYVMHMKLM